MDSVNPKRHVFISYSRQNSLLADQLVTDLEAHNIPCWIDRNEIRHYDNDFLQVIKEGLRDAFALLLLVSPASRMSHYVDAEIEDARTSECPIVVCWVDGDEFHRLVPSFLARSNYADLRESSYATHLARLIDDLVELRDRSVPVHYAASDTAIRPTSHLEVICPKGRIFMRPDGYENVWQFTNDLYPYFRSDKYPPLTYGNSWVLGRHTQRDVFHLVLPWNWLLRPDASMPISQYDREWHRAPLSEYELHRNTVWEVLDCDQLIIFGAIGHSEKGFGAYWREEDQVLSIAPYIEKYIWSGSEVDPSRDFSPHRWLLAVSRSKTSFADFHMKAFRL